MVEKIRIGAVVSEFNYDITMMMLERAKEHAQFLGAEIAQTVKVPGVKVIEFASNVVPNLVLRSVLILTIPGFIFPVITRYATSIFAFIM